ncbi:unnamed protein product [Discosporangium mesarthrocarpum]
MGFFAGVQKPPEDPLLGLNAQFVEDESPSKVNLTVGAFRDEDGLPYPLPVVRKAEQRVANDPAFDHEYLPIDGSKAFCTKTAELMFGDCNVLKAGAVATVQAVGGTGGLRLAFEFLRKCVRIGQNDLVVYLPNPTWPNHPNIAREAMVSPDCIHRYPYYDDDKKSLAFKSMIKVLNAAPRGAVVLLHMCAHNPTGMDPSQSQWETIGEQVVRERELIALFDNAYQGFATGSLDTDAFPVRLFARLGLHFLVVCSFSKSLGLYSARTGALHVVCASAEEASAVRGQLRSLARPMYSNPPAAGAKVTAMILSDPMLERQWREELAGMAGRIGKMRVLLTDALVANGAPGSWDHLTNQRGMFGYTGLTRSQVERLREKWHVYMSATGRVSMAGVNEGNVELSCCCSHPFALTRATVCCPEYR